MYVAGRPGASNNGDDDTGARSGTALVASDAQPAAALIAAARRSRRASSGYRGTSDGWTDLPATAGWTGTTPRRARQRRADRPDALTGLGPAQELTLALGFGGDARGRGRGRARLAARRLRRRGARVRGRLARTTSAALTQAPGGRAAAAERELYGVSAMVLAASEDKTYRGAFVASPTMPWAWGTGSRRPVRRRTTWSGRATSTRSPPR